MLLFVWRRNRTRLAMVSDSLRRRQEQIFNLENQVNCLKHLTKSECDKRNEAMVDCQKTENALQAVQMENTALFTDKTALQDQVAELRKHLHNSTLDIENLKKDINAKTIYIRRLENNLNEEKYKFSKLEEYHKSLVAKVKEQDLMIKMQEEAVDESRHNLQNMEEQLMEIKEVKLVLNLENELMKSETEEMQAGKEKMQRRLDGLEKNLSKMCFDYETLINENRVLQRDLEEEKSMWRITINFAQISWAMLQHAAYLMLPAMHY